LVLQFITPNSPAQEEIMTQFDPLRVGLIGAGGRWGPRAHVPALKGVPEVELYAMCTAHADTAQAAAEKFAVPRAYGSDTALNADAQVEAVAVAVRRTGAIISS
jgi:predicted dehydrogenase